MSVRVHVCILCVCVYVCVCMCVHVCAHDGRIYLFLKMTVPHNNIIISLFESGLCKFKFHL